MISTNSKSLERRIKRLIPLKLKAIILRFLLSRISGRLVQTFFKKTLLGAKFDFRLVDPISAAKIYFGIWESAEIRLAKKYISKNDVVLELGSSVGVMLSTIVSNVLIKKYIAVEASPTAIKILDKVIKNLGNQDIFLVQAAISYSNEDFVNFSETSFTGSRLSYLTKGSSSECIQKCQAVTLSDLLQKENILNTEYVLVTDIEGAEADIFVNDKVALECCKKIICELDETEKYSVKEQMAEIEKCGFALKEYYGNVFVYENKKMLRDT